MSPQVILDYNSLMQEMLSTNAAYLQIAVTVVLALGAAGAILVHFTSIKPFQDKLMTAEEKLRKLTNENKKLLQRTESLQKSIRNAKQESFQKIKHQSDIQTSKFDDLEDKLNNLIDSSKQELRDDQDKIKTLLENAQTKINDLEWSANWDSHYIWEAKGIPINVVSSLVSTLRLSIKINESWRIALVLKSLVAIFTEHLENISQERNWPKLKAEILELLEKIDDEDLKNEIALVRSKMEKTLQ